VIHEPSNHAFGALASAVIFATAGAVALLVYAAMTFVGLLGAAPVRDFLP
jgi:hypothetical protein